MLVDAQDMMNAALSCNPSVTVTAAASLNVLNCGGSYIINTCTDIYGIYKGPYYRSDWLREAVRLTTSTSDRAVFADTSSIDYSHAAEDMAHTRDAGVAALVVQLLVDAVAQVAPISAGSFGPFVGTYQIRTVLKPWPPPPFSVFSPPSPPPPIPPRPMPVYTLLLEAVTYEQAKSKCVLSGGKLAVFANYEEWQNALAVVAAQADSVPRIEAWNQTPVWIGLADQHQEGRFIYEGDLGEGGYRPWSSGEPNSLETDEDCVVMERNQGWKFVDYACGMKAAILCENINLAPPPPSSPPPPPAPPSPPPPPLPPPLPPTPPPSARDGVDFLEDIRRLTGALSPSAPSSRSASSSGRFVLAKPIENDECKKSAIWPRKCSEKLHGTKVVCTCEMRPAFYGILGALAFLMIILAVLKIRRRQRRRSSGSMMSMTVLGSNSVPY